MTESLEQQLDSFDPQQRREALSALWRQAQTGKVALPKPGTGRQSPRAHFFLLQRLRLFAVEIRLAGPPRGIGRGRDRGFRRAGRAGGVFGGRSTARTENLCEPGIARVRAGVCHARHQFARRTGHCLSHGRRVCQGGSASVPVRNARRRVAAHPRHGRRVNTHLRPVELDYDKDVVPLTPQGQCDGAPSLRGIRTQGRPDVSGRRFSVLHSGRKNSATPRQPGPNSRT